MRRAVTAAALTAAGGAFSWLAIAASFDPFTVAGGSEPARIWGAALGWGTTTVGTALLIVGSAATRGRWRVGALAAWVLFLVSATHRVTEHGDGAVADRWLGIAIRRLPGDGDGEPDRPRCTVGRWAARCEDGRGGVLATVSALPMAPLLPGRWER